MTSKEIAKTYIYIKAHSEVNCCLKITNTILHLTTVTSIANFIGHMTVMLFSENPQKRKLPAIELYFFSCVA